ncbi:flagellar biosynthesis protein FlhB [Granulosicoccus sp.]|nr:flagellar biosynthesis protein FlhB [Granulosicoccus sp.]MDB4224387.1 flagellar biosynthesis protein FlhB [Granulosicoccus sp.]
MAGQDTGADKTEDATPKRLADARGKGDVPRSKELNTVLMMLASMLGFAMLGGTGVQAYKQLAKNQWTIARDDLFNDQAVLNGLFVPLIEALWISAPFLFLMFAAVFIGPLCMGGWVFSVSSVKIDFTKLSPIAGMKKMLGIQSLAELLKALMKVILLGAVAVFLLDIHTDDYLRLGSLPISEAINSMFNVMFLILLTLVLTLGLVALVDVPYQQWSHANKLKMTLQEVRDENKEQQGNPEVKGKVRQMQQAMAGKRMLEDVPDADVIIVNPTHFAVALKYDENEVAPRVVAKGIDHLALKIREIGKASDVSIFRAPPLARSLYQHTEIGETIPSELYLAVAQVLAYVMQVKQMNFTDRRRLVEPDDLQIPDSLLVPKDE